MKTRIQTILTNSGCLEMGVIPVVHSFALEYKNMGVGDIGNIQQIVVNSDG